MDSLAENVHKVFYECLFEDHELGPEKAIPADAIIVDGITRKFGLHPQRVEKNRPVIAGFIDEMDPSFRKKQGDGGSFLSLCMDKHGNQWAEQSTCELLVVLAMATKLGGYCLPREFWKILPGGVPYVVFE